ncbi:hypothetical protein DL89DRAFT_325490 [Linderina pennispora]|uniref:NADH dehydrogenase [ubiquinone] 1 beta subcomplex subunit 11, mitochondrial n=1 Tax=Linderina pennispora TaxID=61395 RepID=A0A1Y1VX16_9FUNG|nr:uncharacterized protein DL89DRAFT_325490 [Linderina pennispora]ORX65753.1 hypothetical protein DL89DRAFT_325490 [Linderina pennispora]
MTFQRLAALSTRARIAPRLVRGGHGAQHFNEPGGYLFGVKPGQKYEKEGWETIWVGGFGFAFALAAVGLYYKPDTRQEAERQMREEGDVLEYKHTEYRA